MTITTVIYITSVTLTFFGKLPFVVLNIIMLLILTLQIAMQPQPMPYRLIFLISLINDILERQLLRL